MTPFGYIFSGGATYEVHSALIMLVYTLSDPFEPTRIQAAEASRVVAAHVFHSCRHLPL